MLWKLVRIVLLVLVVVVGYLAVTAVQVWLTSVSYTHLDVYKRQAHGRVGGRFDGARGCPSRGLGHP